MKTNGMLSFLVLSDIRKGIVYALLERPATLNELKQILNPISPLSSAYIIPYLKELSSHNIILKNNGVYYLSPVGKMLANKLKPVLDTFNVIDNNGKFFNDHDLEPIPEYLIERIGELGDCQIVENSLENITATYRALMNQLPNSKSIRGVSPMFDVEYPEAFSSMAEHIPTELILTSNIYNKVKKEYPILLGKYLRCDNAKMYVIDDAGLAFVVTDRFLSLSLNLKNGRFDVMTNLISFKESAIKWGEELFEHYRNKSREITSL
jgi:Predicted transcriptional regulator